MPEPRPDSDPRAPEPSTHRVDPDVDTESETRDTPAPPAPRRRVLAAAGRWVLILAYTALFVFLGWAGIAIGLFVYETDLSAFGVDEIALNVTLFAVILLTSYVLAALLIRRHRRKTLWSTAAVFGLALVAWAGWAAYGHWRLGSELEAWETLGRELFPDAGIEIANADNAAYGYWEIARDSGWQPSILTAGLAPARDDGAFRERLREASARPHCQHNQLDISALEFALMLHWVYEFAADDGDDLVRLRLGRQTLGVGAADLWSDALESYAVLGPPSRDLDEIAAELRQHELDHLVQREVYRYADAYLDRVLGESRGFGRLEDLYGVGLLHADIAELRSRCRAYVEYCALNVPNRPPTLAMVPAPWWAPLTARYDMRSMGISPSTAQLTQFMLPLQTRLALAQAATVLAIHRRDTGAYPASVDELNDQLPRDPGTGDPLGYERKGDGFILRSSHIPGVGAMEWDWSARGGAVEGGAAPDPE